MSWTPKPLGQILEQSGRHRAGDQDLPVLSITMKHGLVDQADKFKKRVASSDTSNYRVAYKNELVVGFPIDEGVLGFQTKYPAGIVSPAYDIWKLRSEVGSHIPYLERYLRSAQARGSYASRMQGAVARRRSLTKTDFLNLEIPFPPLNDQIRIAHLLGKVEGLIAQRKQHLQQLHDLLKSVFLEMFGDPVRNEKGWSRHPLQELCSSPKDIKCGPFGTQLSKSEFQKTGVPVWGIPQINSEFTIPPHDFVTTKKSSELEEYSVRHNDIVMSRKGAVGKCSLYPPSMPPGIMHSDVLRIRADWAKTNPVYLCWQLRLSRDIERQIANVSSGAIMAGINVGKLKSITVFVPPIDLQNQFATVVEKIESLKSRYRQSLTDLEAVYGALSQQAFKGELELSRVVPAVAPIEVESPVAAAVPAPITTPVIELPETDLMLPAMQDRTQLAPLLRFWLQAYRTQLGGVAFSVERFIAAAQTRLSEVHPDNDFELCASDYEIIKAWAFEALAAGALKQAFDDDGNRIELIAATEQSLA
jgi:type I restriction enzyme S subunit